jgi:2-amino-4-hydroxy-6-hydroxymethyldihydropteridine diphosphokinase
LHNCILHLGTNIGAKTNNLQLAEMMISSRIGNISKSSQLYKTAAWGKEDQDDFLNKAIISQTDLTPDEVLSEIHIIEAKLGRQRIEKWGPRIIDIDIIFYGEKIIKKPNLIIPHPHLTNRNFVLIPLMDIIPEFVHPELEQSITELNELCTDTSEVRKYID